MSIKSIRYPHELQTELCFGCQTFPAKGDVVIVGTTPAEHICLKCADKIRKIMDRRTKTKGRQK